MAQVAVASLPQQANGVAVHSQSSSPDITMTSSPVASVVPPLAIPVKRKRSTSDAMDLDEIERDGDSLAVKAPRTGTAGVRDYYDVLTGFDVTPSVLKRRLEHIDSAPADEPQSKLQKTGDTTSFSTLQSPLPSLPSLLPLPQLPSPSVATKVERDEYDHVEDVARDIVAAADSQISSLRKSISKDENRLRDDVAIVATEKFKQKALELLHREQSYPQQQQQQQQQQAHGAGKPPLQMPSSQPSTGDMVLSIWANTPHPRQLYSSLAVRNTKPEDIAAANLALATRKLPPGMSLSRVAFAPPTRDRRVPTFGELFAPPRRQPPLQPPRPTSQPKGNVLSFQTGDLHVRNPPSSPKDNSTNSYFYTKLSVGHYLDYGNATPTAPQAKSTRQRERAQSLAGVRPSMNELEQSEMDALFRRAFSSFAPTRDDSNAVVPASVAARHWWRRSGRRSFTRMIQAELTPSVQVDEEEAIGDDEFGSGSEPEPMEGVQEKKATEATTNTATTTTAAAAALDDEELRQVIESWDDNLVDPSLAQVLGAAKPAEAKSVEEKLQDITDLIETLSSYQHIRNLVLPSSQTRTAGTPVEVDMLAHGSEPVPSEEEVAVYLQLKKDLADMISTLPPFAVAKLGGDKLGDLTISTDIEIRTEHYFGLLADDDTPLQQQQQMQARSRQPPPQASQQTPRPSGQRSAASGSAASFHNNRSLPQSRTPVPPPQFHRPTPLPAPMQQQPRPAATGTPSYTAQNGYQPYSQTQIARPGPTIQQQQQQQQQQMQAGYMGQQPQQPQPQQPQPQQPQPQQPHPPLHLQHRPSFNGMHATPPNARFTPAYPPGYPQQGSTSLSAHGSHPTFHSQYQGGVVTGGISGSESGSGSVPVTGPVPGRTASPQTRGPNPSPHPAPYSPPPSRFPVPNMLQGSQIGRPNSHSHTPQISPQIGLTSGWNHSMTHEEERRTAENVRQRWISQLTTTAATTPSQSFDHKAMQATGQQHKSPSPVSAVTPSYPSVNGQQQNHKSVTPVPLPSYATSRTPTDYPPRTPMTPQGQPAQKPRPQQGQAA